MSATALPSHPAIALAGLGSLVAGATWMALGPQLPALRSRRALLTWITWLATRVGYGVVLSGSIRGWLVWLAADAVVWRVLARLDGEDGEAAWAWAALPMAWCFTLRGGLQASPAVALLALSLLALRRNSRAGFCALAAAAVALGGPRMSVIVLALAAGARPRTGALVAGTLAASAGLLAARFGHLGGVPAAGPAAFSAWTLPAALAGASPGVLTTLAGALAALAGVIVLAVRGASGEDLAVWAGLSIAVLATTGSPADAARVLPLLCVWAARDSDRRGWLLLLGTLVPAAVVLAGGALQGAYGLSWRGIAMLVMAASALLSLWPLVHLARRTPAA